MKNLFLALGIVLLLGACDNGDMEAETNPFVGTWEDDIGTRYVFTKNVATQSNYKNETVYWSGTYTYDDANITIATNYRDSVFEDLEVYPDPFVFQYRIDGTALTIDLAYVQKVSEK